MLAPHLDRPGAARLLVLAVDLLLAGGGPCSLSLTDLTQRLGCARKSVLQALRLGRSWVCCAARPVLASTAGAARRRRRGRWGWRPARKPVQRGHRLYRRPVTNLSQLVAKRDR